MTSTKNNLLLTKLLREVDLNILRISQYTVHVLYGSVCISSPFVRIKLSYGKQMILNKRYMVKFILMSVCKMAHGDWALILFFKQVSLGRKIAGITVRQN